MKLKYIDALRGLAIMGVLIVHCGQKGSNEALPVIIQSAILNGAHGVQLFYVASAFTLFLSIANQKALGKNMWSQFFARRFFRIAPMYYLGICYYLWQDGFGERYWLGDASHITVSNVIANIFFVHGFNPYWITSVVPGGWSIAVEMMFYCLIPLLFCRITNTQQAFRLLLIVLLIRAALQFALIRIPLIESERLWTHYLYFYFPNQLPVFVLGIILYFIVRDGYKTVLSPAIILAAFFFLIAHLVGIPLLPNHVLFSVAFVVLAVALSRYPFRILVNDVMVYIGRVSYSLYLVHFAVLFWLERVGLVDFINISGVSGALVNFSIRLLVLTILSVAIASVTYHLVELPMQRIGKKLIHRRTEPSRQRSSSEVPVIHTPSAAAILPGTVTINKNISEADNEEQ